MAVDVEIPRSLADAASSLTPWPIGLVPFQIRAQALALQGAADASSSALPLVADYYLGAAMELPTADVPVNGSMLGGWKVDIDSVVSVAESNRSQTDANVDAFGDALVITGVPYTAAALRSPRALSQLVGDRTPVIIVPEPGVTIVGFTDDVASLIALAVAAERALAETSHPVSATPLVSSGDEWTVFRWPAAVDTAAHRLRGRWDDLMYAAARPVVTATYEAAGHSVFVSELVLAQNADGDRITYTTVTEMLTLIPRADFVVVRADDGRTAQVLFSSLAARGDVLVPAQGAVPEYFVVNRFPTELL